MPSPAATLTRAEQQHLRPNLILGICCMSLLLVGMDVTIARAHHTDFAQATHPIWWIMVACGAIVISLGWLSNTPWSYATATLGAPPSRR